MARASDPHGARQGAPRAARTGPVRNFVALNAAHIAYRRDEDFERCFRNGMERNDAGTAGRPQPCGAYLTPQFVSLGALLVAASFLCRRARTSRP